MTVKRDYVCDLCRCTIPNYKDGIGVRWASGTDLRNVMISDAETHLCNRCCASLKEMFATMDALHVARASADAA